ncbi:MAG: preprotein translocase subunit YajC [Desulfosalsimonas sp.]
MFDIAYAMGAGGEAGQGGSFGAFIPIILMFVIFYFLLIRPQQKKAKAHQEMINNLKKGDRVVTSGGIHGTITSLDENSATVEISDKVRVKVTRGSIAGVSQASEAGSEK